MMRSHNFTFRPVISKTKMFMAAMMAAMKPKATEGSQDEYPNGSGSGCSGNETMPHISEVAHLS